MEIHSDHSHRVPATSAEVWDAISRTDDYRRWWPWLRRLDADGLRSGAVWHCTVQPPLPYTLRFDIALDDVDDRDHRVEASVSGEIVGSAALRLRPSDDGCEIELSSVLRPASRTLQVVSRLAPWMARFGHDWVIDTGLKQFRRRAL